MSVRSLRALDPVGSQRDDRGAPMGECGQDCASQVDFAQTPSPGDSLAAVVALEVGFIELVSGAVASVRRAAKQQADRISFSELGRRREEIARALTEGGGLAAALSSDETYQSLLKRRNALRRWQVELDDLANRTIENRERTPSRSDPSSSDDVSGSDALAPRSRPGDEIGAQAARSPRRQASGLVRYALYLLSGIAATGGFAAFVQETQVNRPLRNSNFHAPQPDHENLTGVWLHPVLYEAIKYNYNINILSDQDTLGVFLAERGLSLSGPAPIMRIETASTFDDPDLQARFGLKYSYVARDPHQIVDILSILCNPNDKSSSMPNMRDIPRHVLDMANLPEPMDAGAALDFTYRRQEFGVTRRNSPRVRTK
jgi:hypothetical protein